MQNIKMKRERDGDGDGDYCVLVELPTEMMMMKFSLTGSTK